MKERQFKHYMLKEIFENPRAVKDTIAPRVTEDGQIRFEDLRMSDEELRSLERIYILASGTSRHAGLAGKVMIEALAGVHVDVDYASEFQFSSPTLPKHTLSILITQSGETADTLEALATVKAAGSKTLAICNVQGATLAKRADSVIYTAAGPEISIASTKAFTAQMAALFLFAVHLGRVRGTIDHSATKELLAELLAIPEKLERVLETHDLCQQLAEKYYMASDFLFLGRGAHFPAALDGALKLKEVSYVHAEGYPTGEIKHGPYALIDALLPIVFLAGRDAKDPISEGRYRMSVQNMQDVRARNGRVIALITEDCNEVKEITRDSVAVPNAPELLLPLLEMIPLQIFAYHVAVLRGLDVDKPRNLVKSVTEQ